MRLAWQLAAFNIYCKSNLMLAAANPKDYHLTRIDIRQTGDRQQMPACSLHPNLRNYPVHKATHTDALDHT